MTTIKIDRQKEQTGIFVETKKMQTFLTLCCLVIVLTDVPSLANAARAIGDDLVVKTNKGKIQGFETATSDGKKVSAWYGIPYAQPPVGNLRFRHPRDMESWEGIKKTHEQPNSCVQVRDTMWPGFEGAEAWNTNTQQSEDCLYLNVVVPKPHPKNAAVIIWIYGGGFWSGTTTLDLYDLRTMAAEQNIIMVGIQYRVASLAFLYFGTEDVPGNAGMFDQLMAIKWVKNNIAKFGGNPDNITLMGESAGACSVSLHLLSPLSRDLFSQAIMQSATALAPWGVLEKHEAMRRSMMLAKNLKCPHDSNDVRASIDCMMRKKADEIVGAEWDNISHGFTGGIGVFAPVVDGSFLDVSPGQAMKRGNFKKANILLGSNRDEGNYFILYFFAQMFPRVHEGDVFINRTQFLTAIEDAFPFSNQLQKKAIKYEYTNWLNSDDPVSNRVAVDRITGDWEFTCPVVDFAHKYAETGNNVYMYYFTEVASVSPWPKWSGAMHADEIVFVFGQPLNLSQGYNKKEIELSRQIMSYWANFAKTGNPSLYDGHTWTETYWPLHTPLKRETLTLSSNSSEVLEGHGVRKCAFWKRFLPKLGNGQFDGRGGWFFYHDYTPKFEPNPSPGFPPKPCELDCCGKSSVSTANIVSVSLVAAALASVVLTSSISAF